MKQTLFYQTMHTSTVTVREMMRHRGTKKSWQDSDTSFLGGPPLSNDARSDLCAFAVVHNYHLVYVVLDPVAPNAGPIGFEVFHTDGYEQTTLFMNGRLWSERGGKPPVIVFPDFVASMKSGHRLAVKNRRRTYYDAGFEFAQEAFLRNVGKTDRGIVGFADTGRAMCVIDNPMFAD